MNLFFKIPVQLLLQTAEYDYLFGGHEVFQYQTETDLLN